MEILADGQQGRRIRHSSRYARTLSLAAKISARYRGLRYSLVTFEMLTQFVGEAEQMLRAAGGRTQREIKNDQARKNQHEARDHAGKIAAALRDEDKPSPELVSDALNYIPNNMEYDEWIRMGFALYHGLGDGGRALWQRWSAQSHKNDPDLTARKWPSFASGRTITVGTLFWHAAQNGWQRRSSHRPTTGSQTGPRLEPSQAPSDIVTEDSAALIFRDRYKNQFLFDHDMKSWFAWDGKCWRFDKTALAFELARQLTRELTINDSPKSRMSANKVSVRQRRRAIRSVGSNFRGRFFRMGSGFILARHRGGNCRLTRRNDTSGSTGEPHH